MKKKRASSQKFRDIAEHYMSTLLMMRLLTSFERVLKFTKETFADVLRVFTSKQGMKNLHSVSLYRNAVYLMLNSAVTALTGFFFWIVAARLYATETIGLASAVISAVGLLALISILGLDYGLIRFLPNSGEKAGDTINSCLTIGGIVSISLSLIFLAGLPLWSPALLPIRQHPVFLIAFVVVTAACTLFTLSQHVFVAERRTSFILSQGLIASLLRFIPLVLLAPLFPTFGIFASFGIAILIATVIAILFFFPRVHINYRPLPILKKGVINDMVHFSSANYLATALWVSPTLVLPLMVVNFLGVEANAYFYIGWAVGNIPATIPTAASLSLFAEGSYNEQQLGQQVRQSLKFILLLLIPTILIILFLGDKILLLFGTAYSQNATELLWLLALSALPLSINHTYFSIKRVQMKIKSVIALSAFVMVGTLGLSYFLLPQMGILGAGISWLASQTLAALVGGVKLFRDR